MSWKVRHEGSPTHRDGLTGQQVMQGLADGYWEPTDEVMGPTDKEWIKFENHPQFAEMTLDMEPRPHDSGPDETHLDMNALIDVCLVLLIFFILTTSYTQLQKILAAPSVSPDEIDAGAVVVTDKQVQESMVHVLADFQNGRTAVFVEKKLVEVDPDKPAESRDRLVKALREFEGGASKLTLLLEHDDRVPHGILVTIQDAAKSTNMPDVLLAPKLSTRPTTP